MRGTLVGRGSLVVAVAAVLVAAACGGDDDSTEPSNATGPAPDATATATSVASAASVVTTAPATTVPAPTTTAPAPSTTAAPATTTTTMLAATSAGPDLRIDVLSNTDGDAPGTPPWIHVESTKCGGPVGDWPLTVSGVKDMGGGLVFVVQGSGTATLTGTAAAASGSFTAEYTLDVQGIPLSTGGQIASYVGTATFAGSVLTLDGAITGTSHGENPYRQVMMSMFPSTQVMALPATPGTYC